MLPIALYLLSRGVEGLQSTLSDDLSTNISRPEKQLENLVHLPMMVSRTTILGKANLTSNGTGTHYDVINGPEEDFVYPNKNWKTFYVNVVSMFMLKLLCGMDDLALLTAIVGTKNTRQNNVTSALYLVFILFIGALSWIAAQVAYQVLEGVLNDGFWDPERVSAVVFGGLLMLLGIREYFQESDDEEEAVEEEESLVKKPAGSVDVTTSNLGYPESSAPQPIPEGEAMDNESVVKECSDTSKTNTSVFRYAGVVGMLALDDSVVFTCMIQGSDVNLLDVMLGMFLGSLLIIIVCRFVSSITLINSLIQRIPKWALIVGLGIWVIVGGFLEL